MSGPLTLELRRLSRGRARTEGRRTARRTLLLLLLVLLVAALVHRILLPLPPLLRLEGHPLWTLLVLALAIPVAWLLGRAVALAARPPRRAFARRLDDDLRLDDALDTALTMEGRRVTGPLEGLALEGAARRLSALDPATLWPAYRGGKRLPVLLVLATLFVLFAPGRARDSGRSPPTRPRRRSARSPRPTPTSGCASTGGSSSRSRTPRATR